MAGSSNVIPIIFLLTNKCSTNAAIETLLNNNQVLSDTNDINEQNITCRAVRSFCWYLSENYDKKLEPWEHPDAKNKSLPYYYDFDFPVNGIQEVDDFKHTIKLEMYFIIKCWRGGGQKIPKKFANVLHVWSQTETAQSCNLALI